MATTIAEPKGAGGDLSDGLHAAAGVEYLARLEGFDGDKIPATVILTRGFSETTGFFADSKGRGYWMTTLNECSCPDYRFRKAGTDKLCKHQKLLSESLERKARIDERNRQRDEAAVILADIHRRQDRIQATHPETYFELEAWRRLDERAQKICAAVGW
jgi:hypothetical protein